MLKGCIKNFAKVKPYNKVLLIKKILNSYKLFKIKSYLPLDHPGNVQAGQRFQDPFDWDWAQESANCP